MKNGKNGSSFVQKYRGALSIIISIIVGLLVGFVIMLISRPSSAVYGFGLMLSGGMSSGDVMKNIGQVLYYATPIMMTGASVAFAFKTNLFNIGASGQFIVGAFAAVYVGVRFTALGGAQWVVAILAAILAGALWGAIPGFLKAYCNVNEVISCIMMNYIGMYSVNSLVKNNIYNQLKNESQPIAAGAKMPELGLTDLFAGSQVHCGIIIAIVICIVLFIILSKTNLGYEMKACGFNRDAGRYAGINEKKNIILAMTIAGALAGLGGALLYLSGSGKYIAVADSLADEGFTGISVALLGSSHPIGVIFSALLMGYLKMGGNAMQLAGFKPEVVTIITSVIIYFAAFSLLFQNIFSLAAKRGEGRRLKSAARVLETQPLSVITDANAAPVPPDAGEKGAGALPQDDKNPGDGENGGNEVEK